MLKDVRTVKADLHLLVNKTCKIATSHILPNIFDAHVEDFMKKKRAVESQIKHKV